MAERPGRFHEDEVEERASERDRVCADTSVFQLDGILCFVINDAYSHFSQFFP